MRSRLPLVALVLCLAILAGLLAAPPARADCGLNNNSFEGGFIDHFGDNYGWVAPGWTPWYQDGPHQESAQNWRPAYGSFDSWYLGGARVHGGSQSQKFGTQWATHNAGVYQRVSVPRDSQVTFKVWALAWSSQGSDPTTVSGPGNYRVYVGIDPTGGQNWAAPSVRWSEPRMEYNNWMELSISARAEADAVTVFLRGHCEYPVMNNESTWDDACLTVVPPTPRPTNTPLPTSPPTVTPLPTATATPTPSPTPVTGSICVQAFSDDNGNGMRDDGEAALPGVRFALLDDQRVEVASQEVGAEPHCFEGLPEASYTVKVSLPSGYEATTAQEWLLSLPAGGSANANLGLRALPTPTPVPTATNTPTPVSPVAKVTGAVGRGIYAVSGVLLALLAIALPFGWRYLRVKE